MSNQFFPKPIPSIIEMNIERKKKQEYIKNRNDRLKELDNRIRKQRQSYGKKRKEKQNDYPLPSHDTNRSGFKYSSFENQIIKTPVTSRSPHTRENILPKICKKPIMVLLCRKNQEFSRTL